MEEETLIEECPSCGHKNVKHRKSWKAVGKGDVILITYLFRCPKCKHSWREHRSG